MVGGLLLAGLPLVANAAPDDLRPKPRPAALVLSAAPQAAPALAVAPQAAVPAEAAVQPALAQVAALRPVPRPAALVRRLERAARASETQSRAPSQPQLARASVEAGLAPQQVSARVSTMRMMPRPGVIAENRRSHAMQQASARRAKGQRVWCVPFARDLSGVSLQGNAHTWWGKAAGQYDRGHQPVVGAVMNFKSTRGMPLGHVAVVSKVEDSRRIQIDHANWHRNRVSIGMVVVDVSAKNDWSRVRVESGPGGFGAVYPVAGFIHPARG